MYDTSLACKCVGAPISQGRTGGTSNRPTLRNSRAASERS